MKNHEYIFWYMIMVQKSGLNGQKIKIMDRYELL